MGAFKRTAKLYAAHIVVLVVYIAAVEFASHGLHDPDDLSQFNIAVFVSKPSWEWTYFRSIFCCWERLLQPCG
jgi:hypothetical protein